MEDTKIEKKQSDKLEASKQNKKLQKNKSWKNYIFLLIK